MTTYLADTFTRANSATSAGTPDTGGPYTAQVGVWGINANQLYQPTSTSSAVLTADAAADFDATFQFTASPGSNSVGFLFRYSNSTTFWLVYVSNGILNIQRRVSGTGTVLSGSGWATVVTDVYRVVAKGSIIQIYINGVLTGQFNDPFNQTQTPVGFWISTTTGARIDNVLVQDAPTDLTNGIDGMTANTPDDTAILTALDFPLPDSFAYLGHGSKTADTGAS